jgi:hypothetical protein
MFVDALAFSTAQVSNQEGIPFYALHKGNITGVSKSVSVLMQKCGGTVFLSYAPFTLSVILSDFTV